MRVLLATTGTSTLGQNDSCKRHRYTEIHVWKKDQFLRYAADQPVLNMSANYQWYPPPPLHGTLSHPIPRSSSPYETLKKRENVTQDDALNALRQEFEGLRVAAAAAEAEADLAAQKRQQERAEAVAAAASAAAAEAQAQAQAQADALSSPHSHRTNSPLPSTSTPIAGGNISGNTVGGVGGVKGASNGTAWGVPRDGGGVEAVEARAVTEVGAAVTTSAGGVGDEGGVSAAGSVDMTRTSSLSSVDSVGDGDRALGAIEEGYTEEAEVDDEQEDGQEGGEEDYAEESAEESAEELRKDEGEITSEVEDETGDDVDVVDTVDYDDGEEEMMSEVEGEIGDDVDSVDVVDGVGYDDDDDDDDEYDDAADVSERGGVSVGERDSVGDEREDQVHQIVHQDSSDRDSVRQEEEEASAYVTATSGVAIIPTSSSPAGSGDDEAVVDYDSEADREKERQEDFGGADTDDALADAEEKEKEDREEGIGSQIEDGDSSSDNAREGRIARKPRLSLEKGMYAKDDEEAEAFAVAAFAAAEGRATASAVAVAEVKQSRKARGFIGEGVSEGHREGREGRGGRGGRSFTRSRSSACYSVSPRVRRSVPSRSLSPIPRKGDRAQRRVHMRSPSIAGHDVSPMSRLTPAEHGLETGGNTVVIELGAWRVRTGVVDSGGAGGAGRRGFGSKSFFDDFPCCVARPRQEGADLNELVNGASSLAAPMYSKFRE